MTAARFLSRGRDLIRPQALPLLALTLWMVAPLAVLIDFAVRHSDTLTGVSGYDTFDQLAYLAWIRDEGSHVLASNLWQIGPTAHDYLHPMYIISGLLWRAGVSLQVSYLIWKPIALVVLFLGFAAYVRHLLGGRRWQQTAALVLALFYLTPALQLAQWTGRLSLVHRLQLLVATNDSDSALNLWGFEHAAITIGLMPVFLVGAERILARGARARGWVAVTAVAGALISWLQPWQGVTVLAILAAMFFLVPPRRRFLSLTIPVVAALAPLFYGEALSHYDPVWRAFQTKTTQGGAGPLWALAVGFAPLVALALLGVRRPRDDRTWMLALWVPACAAVYLLVPEFPPHALKGVTLPLSILAVSGWETSRRRLQARVRIPQAAVATVAVLAIALFTVPAGIYQIDSADGFTSNSPGGLAARQLVVLSSDQAAAMRYLNRSPIPGAVLAPWYLSMSVPADTGREVYAGHPMWQPAANVTRANLFYASSGPAAGIRRAILQQSGASFVIDDCGGAPGIAAAIAPITRPVAKFGCLTVYRYTGV